MDYKTYKINSGFDETGVKIEEHEMYGTTRKDIKGIQLNFDSSTARARIFNIGLKLAVFDWQDPIIDIVEKLIEDRIIEIATGKTYFVKCEKSNGCHWNTYIRADNEDRAKYLIETGFPGSKAISVDEYIAETN